MTYVVKLETNQGQKTYGTYKTQEKALQEFHRVIGYALTEIQFPETPRVVWLECDLAVIDFYDFPTAD